MTTTKVAPSVGTCPVRRAKWLSLKKRLLILGSGELAKDLCNVLTSKCRGSIEVVGFVDHDAMRIGERLMDVGIIGTYDSLFEIVERHQVQAIAVCVDDRRDRLPVRALLDCKVMGLVVVDGHNLYEEETGRLSIDALWPSVLIFSTGFQRRVISGLLKRSMDVFLAGLGLMVLAPFFLIVALAIKVDSPGPVFYRQMRVGLRGQPYMIWKFRSMSNDAEKNGPRWALAGDPRVSRVGRWLRKSRIDEVPQFINVLKGEMSLVGPRPERPVFVQELRERIPYYDLRHTVRPGITGWAQIRFRYGASTDDAHKKLQYDLYYVKNLSVGLDLHILVHTARVILLGEGAR